MPITTAPTSPQGSGGYYDEFSTVDALKLALINHCPPLVPSFDIAMADLPEYPGPVVLQHASAGH